MPSRKIYSSQFILLLCQVLNHLSCLGVFFRKCVREAGVDCRYFYFTFFAALLVKRPSKGVSKYIEFNPG